MMNPKRFDNLILKAKAGVAVTDRGFINVDIQMRTNVPHIFAIGDVAGQPIPANKAAEVLAGELQGNKELPVAAFNARAIPSMAYTYPEVVGVGLTDDQVKTQGIKVKKDLFPWAASVSAIANGREEGVTKLLFDDSPETHSDGKNLGGGIVGTHAGDMIGEIALATEMGEDAVDVGTTSSQSDISLFCKMVFNHEQLQRRTFRLRLHSPSSSLRADGKPHGRRARLQPSAASSQSTHP